MRSSFVIATLLLLTLLPTQTAIRNIELLEVNESQSHSMSTFQMSLEFNGTRAFSYLEAQCAFGPRPPGSNNLTQCGDYIISVLEGHGWAVQTQSWTFLDTSLRNIIAGAIFDPRYVILAHYDTRPIADYEPEPINRSKPILGANDGGSGVAALLELAEVLPDNAKTQVVLLFVDAEDSGSYNNWPWIVGSTYYVNTLTTLQKTNIQAAVLLDMMGDADLQILRERSSTPELVNTIWKIASNLNYSHLFVNTSGYTILDDHRPFLDAGIPAVDIIDFDYPYWHTLADTPDKCSAASLEAVGRVVEEFIQQQLVDPTFFRPSIFNPIMIWLLGGLVIGIGVIIGFGVDMFLRHRRRGK